MDITFKVRDAEYLNCIFKNTARKFYSFVSELDIGDISDGFASEQRRLCLSELLKSSSDNPAYIEEFHQEWEENRNCFNKLEEAVCTEEDIYIWYWPAPDAICGMYAIIDFFLNRKNHVYIIKLPGYQVDISSVTFCHYWEDYSFKGINPDGFIREHAIKLPTEILRTISGRWKEFVVQNSMLRVLINEKLINADETFYDFMITSKFTNYEKKVIEVIADIIMERYAIPQWWIERRIHYFIQKGELIICSKASDFYRQKIRLAGER